MKTQEWRALLRQLRKAFPVATPVIVRKRVKFDCAGTYFDGYRYHVTIRKKQTDTELVDSILHEWGHVLAIEDAYQHDGPWAVKYGKVYQEWCDGFKGKVTNDSASID